MQQREPPPPPPEPGPARILPPNSLLEACRLGVAARELENADMYDQLLAATEQADVRMVLERLQAASRDHHLPAFQRCVARGGVAAAGRGGGGRSTRVPLRETVVDRVVVGKDSAAADIEGWGLVITKALGQAMLSVTLTFHLGLAQQ